MTAHAETVKEVTWVLWMGDGCLSEGGFPQKSDASTSSTADSCAGLDLTPRP